MVKIRVFMKSIHKKNFNKKGENSLHTPRFMSVFVTFLAEGKNTRFSHIKSSKSLLWRKVTVKCGDERGVNMEKNPQVPLKNVG